MNKYSITSTTTTTSSDSGLRGRNAIHCQGRKVGRITQYLQSTQYQHTLDLRPSLDKQLPGALRKCQNIPLPRECAVGVIVLLCIARFPLARGHELQGEVAVGIIVALIRYGMHAWPQADGNTVALDCLEATACRVSQFRNVPMYHRIHGIEH